MDTSRLTRTKCHSALRALYGRHEIKNNLSLLRTIEDARFAADGVFVRLGSDVKEDGCDGAVLSVSAEMSASSHVAHSGKDFLYSLFSSQSDGKCKLVSFGWASLLWQKSTVCDVASPLEAGLQAGSKVTRRVALGLNSRYGCGGIKPLIPAALYASSRRGR